LIHAEVKILFCPENRNRVFGIPPASGSIFSDSTQGFLSNGKFFSRKTVS